MIVGNGLLARAFAPIYGDNPHITVFASGVSNSRESRPQEFARECGLLRAALGAGRRLLYFSTCSIGDPELLGSAYVQHKLAMEHLVCGGARDNAVFRLPQVVGHTPNPHTLTNFLHHQIANGLPFHVWRGAWRNLIDVDDVARIVQYLVGHGLCGPVATTVASPFSVPVTEVVGAFETVLARKAICDFVDAGGKYGVDASVAREVAAKVGICFDDLYVLNLIRKYYG